MRKLKQLLAFTSASVLASFNTQASCVPANCNTLGYTKSASDCDGSDMIKCPFDTDKVWCMDVEPKTGMILYSDGTVSENVVSSKTAVGVVAYVEGSTRFAVALAENSSLKWSTPGSENLSCLTDYDSISSAQTDFNGAQNTSCIINYSSSNSYPAAEYCNNYRPVSSGTGSSGWYLPAAGELYVMSSSYEAINLGLQKLSKTKLQNAYYWSSSETNNGDEYALSVNPSDGLMGGYYVKPGNARVRCVLAF